MRAETKSVLLRKAELVQRNPWQANGRKSKAIKDARHAQPAAPSATAGVLDRRMPDARVAGTVMGI
jgi:hypothetical protein